MIKLSNHVLTIAAVLFAIPVGSGLYTFLFANGLSYLSTNPAACANCHVMRETFDDWSKGPHARVAVCTDCHLPHDTIGKWYTKAENGFMHSLAMTLGHVEQIKARPVSKQIALNNCIRCHDGLVNHFQNTSNAGSEPLDCTSCHKSIGHLHTR